MVRTKEEEVEEEMNLEKGGEIITSSSGSSFWFDQKGSLGWLSDQTKASRL